MFTLTESYLATTTTDWGDHRLWVQDCNIYWNKLVVSQGHLRMSAHNFSRGNLCRTISLSSLNTWVAGVQLSMGLILSGVWLPSKIALVNSKEFRREVKDDRCYSQESLHSQDNNLVHLTKADDRRITRMKTWTTRITLVIQTWRLQLFRAETQQHERSPSSWWPPLTYYCTTVVTWRFHCLALAVFI